LSSSKPHPQDAPSQEKQKSSPENDNKFLPNILVVSIISFFIVVSLLVVILVIVKSSTRCGDEANERATTESQRSEIVTEVVMMEPIADTADIASCGKGAGTDVSVNDSQTGSEMTC